MPEKQDLRALIQDRKAKQSRPIIRHTFSLAPELFSDLGELREQARLEQSNQYDPDYTDPDPRMGKPKAKTLADQIRDLEAEIESTSVVAVFKAPTRARQAEFNAMFQADDDDPGKVSTSDLETMMILDAFQTFERNREPISADELGKPDLIDLLEALSQGETTSIATKIASVSGGTPDIPLSVRQSLNSRK
jgi:hypothetical protein